MQSQCRLKDMPYGEILPRSPWRSLHRAKIVAKCDWRTRDQQTEKKISELMSTWVLGDYCGTLGSRLTQGVGGRLAAHYFWGSGPYNQHSSRRVTEGSSTPRIG